MMSVDKVARAIEEELEMQGENRSIWVVAVEPSAENLALPLIQSLKRRGVSDIRVMGGPRMVATGLPVLLATEGIPMHGLIEIFSKINVIVRERNKIVRRMVADPPALVVVVDSVSLGVRMFDFLPRSVGRVQYVAPMLWVWGRHRAKFCRNYNLLLTLFPFEERYFQKVLPQTACELICVGHPLLHPLPDPYARPPLTDKITMVALYPGSRRGELKRHIPIMYNIAKVMLQRWSGAGHLVFRMPVLPQHETLARDILRPLIRSSEGQISPISPTSGISPHLPNVASNIASKVANATPAMELVTDPTQHPLVMREARVAVAASGTITLELSIAGVPHVMIGTVDPIMRILIPIVRADTRWLHLVNKGCERTIVPEATIKKIDTNALALTLIDLIGDAGDEQRRALVQGLTSLVVPGAMTSSDRAAEAIVGMLSHER